MDLRKAATRDRTSDLAPLWRATRDIDLAGPSGMGRAAQNQKDVVYAMSQTKLLPAIFLSVLAPILAFAQTSSARASLKLLPAPKEVRLGKGTFAVTSATRIYVEGAHAADRTAAETLAHEILDQSALKVSIEKVQEPPARDGVIVLARLSDSCVRSYLVSKGVDVRESLGEQGYILCADSSRITVAGATGQGLFYGVQTLLQLLNACDDRLELAQKTLPPPQQLGFYLQP